MLPNAENPPLPLAPARLPNVDLAGGLVVVVCAELVAKAPNGEADPVLDANPEAANAAFDVWGSSEVVWSGDLFPAIDPKGDTEDVFPNPIFCGKLK